MSLTAEAEWLATLDELAQACAECFAAARCAGLDVTAVGQTARAAAILGAPLSAIQAQVPPYTADVQYLGQIEVIREALRQKIAELRSFIRRARSVKRQAAAGMRQAVRERDMAKYRHYLQIWLDAVHAISIAHDGVSACEQAGRCLAWARIRFAEAYEGTESDVAGGTRMPHEGRWIATDGSDSVVRAG